MLNVIPNDLINQLAKDHEDIFVKLLTSNSQEAKKLEEDINKFVNS